MKLIREGLVKFEGNHQHAWPLKITAVPTPGEGLPAEIFVYHAGLQGSLFEAVASLHQIYNLDLEPRMDIDPCVPYYRASTVVLAMLSEADCEERWRRIQDDVRDLVDNHKAFQQLQTVAEVEIV